MATDILQYMMTGQHPGFDERALNERWADVPPPADEDALGF